MIFAGCTKFSQILAILPIAIDEFVIGLTYGWISPTIKYLQQANDDDDDGGFQLDSDQISWVASLHELGRFLGPFLVAFLSRYLGRKPIIVLTALLYVISWLCVVLTRSVLMLYAARLIVGIGLGFSDTVSYIYVGEITTPDVRGKSFSVMYAVCLCGMLTAYTFGTYLSYGAHSALILSLAVLFLLSCSLLIETPHYLLGQNEEQSARNNLAKVRQDASDDAIRDEFDDIRRFIQPSEKNVDRNDCYKELILKDSVNAKILRLVVSLSLLGSLTGYFTINYYSNLIFPSNDLLTSNHFTMVFGVVLVISACVSSAVIDSYGRRFLLLTFSSLTIVLHGISTVLYFAEEKLHVAIPNFSWIIFLTTASYSAAFTFGFLPASLALRSEMFPQNMKTLGCSLTVLTSAVLIFLQTKIFTFIVEFFGMYFNFLLYTAIGVAMFFVTYFKLPETKRKTFSEIQKHFQENY